MKSENSKNGAPDRRSWLYNWLTLAGVALVLSGAAGVLFILLAGLVMNEPPAYLSLMIIPLALLAGVGVVLVPASAWVDGRRNKAGKPPLQSRFRLDLANPAHRWTLLGLLSGSLVTIVLLFTVSVKGFEVLESNEFCGGMCHSVMSPEYTAYRYSSHARVQCVECHIGSGAEWFVRSKLSGLRQVIAVALNSYPRPIPTPIHDLRPARETCERCHWPKKFIGFKEIVRSYFKADESNDPYRIRMLMKIGGEGTSLMKGSGIHYHMLLANKVEYIARDSRRQDIAWVRVTAGGDGAVKTFEDSENPLTAEQKNTLETRAMDCMDCHNRPSHEFQTPMHLVNQALNAGVMDTALPYLKRRAVEALDQDYATTEAAMAGIETHLRDFYRLEYPALLAREGKKVTKAIQETQAIYRRSIFPEMKAKWSAYPNNKGHRDWPGCFRCHNDRLVSKAGDTIFTTCNKCHLILAQGKNIEEVNVNFTTGLPFRHPDDDEEIEEFTECWDCHTGGAALYE